MWFFGHKKLSVGPLMSGLTDAHSHILPGVDDGVRTLKESLSLLHRYEELGVRTVWLTPHIMEDIPNETAFLRARFEELRAAYDGPIALHLAAEHMLDALFEERLEHDDVLPHGEAGQELLVETSYFNPPMGMKDILKSIQKKGYVPLLAHPERYRYMDEDEYRRLRAMGVHFQLNLFALSGAYSPGACLRAQYLLQKGYYDSVGTDVHAWGSFERCVRDGRIEKKYFELVQSIITRQE